MTNALNLMYLIRLKAAVAARSQLPRKLGRAMICNILAFTAIGTFSASAIAACPTNHFEPSFNLGAYFPGSDKILAEQLSAEPDAELALMYVEFGRRDPEFGSVYMISIVRYGLNGAGNLLLNRIKDGKPVSRQVRMSASKVRAIIEEVTPALLKTRYSPTECNVHYTHGVYSQMAVEHPGRGLIGGEVFSPIEDSEAGKVVAIGRKLKERALSGEGF